jgi:predicted NACHT family NTPase
MPTEVREVKVLISCPGDVENEKQTVKEVCDILSKIIDPTVRARAIEWKTDVPPLITGEGAQSVINCQINDNYDIYIGILWKRFGDKQPNGLTPTEEEFENALKSYKGTRKPLISVYFKKDPFYPPTKYDTEQFLSLQKFEERVRTLGLYAEFKETEFKDKIFVDIGSKIRDWNKLTAPNAQKISEPVDYLQRKAVKAQEYKETEFSFLLNNHSKDTVDIVLQNNRIVLLGDAGVGKTTELKRIQAYFSDGSLYRPFFLLLNKYVDESIPDLLGSAWLSQSKDNSIIIMDGLDEIEAENKNNAIRKIESFSENYPNVKIIVSCRRNFYSIEKQGEPGTLYGFSSYILTDLDNNNIAEYIEKKLGNHAEAFRNATYDLQLNALLRAPFYLVTLLKSFLANGYKLPKSKASIFESLVNDTIKLDSTHFRTTIELEEKRTIIRKTLERLALGMEILGKNYLTSEEYTSLVHNDSVRDLTKYCTVWRKIEGRATTWQFEHNNFQEYFAAKALSKKPIEMIKSIVSFKPDYNRIVPSWVNTLSFLMSISEDPTLVKWILETDPEFVVKIEPTRLDRSIRSQVFRRIFSKYKEKQIWIPMDKFDYHELAQFGESEDNSLFLLNEIENAKHYTTSCNAMRLLGFMDIPLGQRERATRILLDKILQETEYNRESKEVQNQALITMSRLKFSASSDIIDMILSKLSQSESDLIRSGLYYLLLKSDYLDEHIDIFLDGIRFTEIKVSSNMTNTIMDARVSEESWNLIKGLEKIKSPEAIKKVLFYLTQNYQHIDNTPVNSILPSLAENAAIAYCKEPQILELSVNLLSVMVNEHIKEDIQNFIHFFDETNTRLKVFQIYYKQASENNNLMNLLATLADDSCLEFMAKQYETGKATEKEIWTFQNFLAFDNHDLFLPFNQLINKKSDNKFMLPEQKDFDKEIIDRRAKDIDLLFNKEGFIQEIKKIFETERVQVLTSDILIETMTHFRENGYFSDLTTYTMLQIAKKQPTISFDEILQTINCWDWDLFRISQLYDYFEKDKDMSITDSQKEWISKWCYDNLSKVDFKTALTVKSGRQSSASYPAIYLWYFHRKLDLMYPQNVLLDMLSFDWVEGCKMVGIQYLANRLPKAVITERVLENLKKGIKSDDVLKNHIDYCKGEKVKEALPYAIAEISNNSRAYETRKAALDAIGQISETPMDLESLLDKIFDDFKWDIVEKLTLQNSEHNHQFLLRVLANGSNEEKMKAATFLLSYQDIEGLKYYVSWIKEHKSVPERFPEKSPLENLENIAAIPYLVDLLIVSYDKELIDSFHSLYNIVLKVLTTIALKSEDNYTDIKQVVEKFILTHQAIKGVNFLNDYLDELEQKFFVSKSEKLSIIEVSDLLDSILGE